MKVVIVLTLAWFLGSYICYRTLGTGSILPYIGITVVLAVLGIWLSYRKSAGPRS